MKRINIFVGGSTKLKAERTYIKALTNDLNSGYLPKGIYIIAKSYEQFKDHQDEYNDFIENEADIAIFIVDGELGPNTKEEFFLATDTLREKHRPEVIVFMSDKKTPEMDEAKHIVSTKLGDGYYVPYKDLDDLKNQAKTRISMFALETDIAAIEEERKQFEETLEKERKAHKAAMEEETRKFNAILESEKNQSKAVSEKKSRKLLFSYLLLGLVSLAFIGLLVHYLNLPKNNNTGNYGTDTEQLDTIIPAPLIFAGGGSVRNFIKEETDVAVDNYKTHYKNPINIPLPSGTAWRILTEELQRQSEFYTICLSADTMTKAFKENHNLTSGDLATTAKIVQIHIGNDPLTVYINNNLYETIKPNLKNEKKITCKELADLLNKINNKEIKATIYTTTEKSGTLTCYATAMKETDSTIIHQYTVFYDYTKRDNIQKGNANYVIMGSKHYKVNGLRKEAYTPLELDKNGPVLKPICLYFLAYSSQKKDEKENVFTIAKPIQQFINQLHPDNPKDNKTAWKRLIEKGEILDSDEPVFSVTIKK